MNDNPINSRALHGLALAVVSLLMAQDPAPNSESGRLLTILADMIAAYEKQEWPNE